MANKFAREGLTNSEMGLLSRAFQEAEGSAEERWMAAKKVVPFCTNLDEGFKAWCFRANGVPLAKADPKAQKHDPLK